MTVITNQSMGAYLSIWKPNRMWTASLSPDPEYHHVYGPLKRSAQILRPWDLRSSGDRSCLDQQMDWSSQGGMGPKHGRLPAGWRHPDSCWAGTSESPPWKVPFRKAATANGTTMKNMFHYWAWSMTGHFHHTCGCRDREEPEHRLRFYYLW